MKAASSGEIVISHAIPGRLRVRVPSVRSAPWRAVALQRWLSRRDGIAFAAVQPLTGSVLLDYSRSVTSPEALLHLINEGLAATSSLPTSSLDGNTERRPAQLPGREPSLRGRAAEVGALSGFVAYASARSLIFRAPLSQAAFGPVAAVAGLGAIPLIRRAWREVRSGRGWGLFPLLAATCLVGIGAGQALTALEVVWILRAGMLLEDYVERQSRRAVRQALELAPRTTRVLVDGLELEVPVEKLRVGDTAVVGTEERLPADGVVLRGEALVDESHISGRADPVLRGPGDRVYAGTVLREGTLALRAAQVGDGTYLAGVLLEAEKSLARRAPVERRADELASRLMRLGAATTLGTLLLTASPLRALTVMLVMSCPCATVLAASTAVTAAIANAARHHVLVKGGLYLERFGKADCFCFDKTGTITTNAPQILAIVPREASDSPSRLLSLAAAAEAGRSHPLARALQLAAASEGLQLRPIGTSESVLGRGVRAAVGPDSVLVGNERLMREEGVDVSPLDEPSRRALDEGQSVLYLARNGQAEGMIGVASTPREGARSVLGWLRRDGVAELHLLTGDAEAVARTVSQDLGFDAYQGDLLPEAKALYVDALQSDSRTVVVVGDGVNDSLALSRAGVGVALGAGGSPVAIEAADVALMDDDLAGLVRLRQVSRQTLRVVEQNHWLAIGTNVLGAVLGATGAIAPVAGGALHVAHALAILINSSRLLGWEPDRPSVYDQEREE